MPCTVGVPCRQRRDRRQRGSRRLSQRKRRSTSLRLSSTLRRINSSRLRPSSQRTRRRRSSYLSTRICRHFVHDGRSYTMMERRRHCRPTHRRSNNNNSSTRIRRTRRSVRFLNAVIMSNGELRSLICTGRRRRRRRHGAINCSMNARKRITSRFRRLIISRSSSSTNTRIRRRQQGASNRSIVRRLPLRFMSSFLRIRRLTLITRRLRLPRRHRRLQ